MDAKVKIEGWREINRALRSVSKTAPVALRLSGNEAAKLLINRTQPKIPKLTGRGAASLKASSTRTSARVSMGGPRAPWMPWLDFGGRTGRRRSVKREFLKEGRYLYPTLREIRPQIEKSLKDGIIKAARDAGLDVS